ncbi:MAG: ROK family protein [Phycisphaerales bacterium]
MADPVPNLASSSGLRLGVDLGGTKIEAALLARDGSIVWRERTPTPRDDYRRAIDAIASVVFLADEAAGERLPVGLGFPGSISPRTGMQRNSNSECLNGQPILEDLSKAIARPVRAENDANCFALSEASDGAAAGFGVVFGVILGTGVGGGVVVDGKVLRGRNGIGGEWGHTALPRRGEEDLREAPRTCYCGNIDCLERWIAGPAVEREHQALTGRDWRLPAIAEAAAAGDREATAALERLVDRLARGLASVCDILDPDAIVLGGGVGNLAILYERLPGALAREVFSDTFDTAILKPKHGDSSGVRGAAWLWPLKPS